MPVAERTIRLDTGLHYHLLEWDAPSDHTVIFLHGFLDNAWGWQPAIEAGLAGRFHIVAPDWRGHGDSDRVGAGGYYYFADYLADLDDLLKKVGRARVSLVGHSMGGNVAVYFTGAFPSRVSRLALLEAVAPPHQQETGPERMAAWIDSWRRARERPQHTYATIDEAAARLIERDPKLELGLARRLAEHGTTVDPDGRRRFKHDPSHLSTGPYSIRVEVARTFWERVTCPTLMVDADESEWRAAAALRATIAHARRETITGAAHMLQRHQPAAVAALLVDFLSAE